LLKTDEVVRAERVLGLQHYIDTSLAGGDPVIAGLIMKFAGIDETVAAAELAPRARSQVIDSPSRQSQVIDSPFRQSACSSGDEYFDDAIDFEADFDGSLDGSFEADLDPAGVEAEDAQRTRSEISARRNAEAQAHTSRHHVRVAELEVAASEKDAKLVQKLGQLQPFIAVFPRECMGQLACFAGPT
jgi:hypothetical protein